MDTEEAYLSNDKDMIKMTVSGYAFTCENG